MAHTDSGSSRSGGSLFRRILSGLGSSQKDNSKGTKSVTKDDINAARVFGLGEAREMGTISTREAINLIKRHETSQAEFSSQSDELVFSTSRVRGDGSNKILGHKVVKTDETKRFDALNNVFPNSNGSLLSEPASGSELKKSAEDVRQNLEKIEKKARINKAKELARKSGYETSATLVRSVVKHGAGCIAYAGEARIRNMVHGDGKDRFALKIDSEMISAEVLIARPELQVKKKTRQSKFERKTNGIFEGEKNLRAPKKTSGTQSLFVSKGLGSVKLISSWLLLSSVKKQAALAVQPIYTRLDIDRPNTEVFFTTSKRSGLASGHAIMKTVAGIDNVGDLCGSLVHVFRSRLVLNSSDKHFSFHPIEKRSYDMPCFSGWANPCETTTSGATVVAQIESYIGQVARTEGKMLSQALAQGRRLALALKKTGHHLSAESLENIDLSLNERFGIYRDHQAVYEDTMLDFLATKVSFRGREGTLGQLLGSGVDVEQSELSQSLFFGDYSFGLVLCHTLMLCQEARAVSNKSFLVLALLDKLIRKSDLIKGKGSLSDEAQGEDATELRSFLLAEGHRQAQEMTNSAEVLGASLIFLGASGEAKNFLKLQNKASLPASEIEFMCKNMPNIRKTLIKEGVLFRALEDQVRVLLTL